MTTAEPGAATTVRLAVLLRRGPVPVRDGSAARSG